jgi:hypothetical protein
MVKKGRGRKNKVGGAKATKINPNPMHQKISIPKHNFNPLSILSRRLRTFEFNPKSK